MESLPENQDAETEAMNLAQRTVAPEVGWPSVSHIPEKFKAPGRFGRAFPLSLPRGIADMFDARLVDVSPPAYVQHVLRHSAGMLTDGLRGHREVWALINTLLILESEHKGFAVQQNVMRRLGGRLAGHRITTKGQLQRMIEDEEQVRGIIHQLMTVGRDVRSTPMSWSYEGKKLKSAVAHLAWRPPWLFQAGEESDELRMRFLGANQQMFDKHGLGRTPMHWFTQNCA